MKKIDIANGIIFQKLAIKKDTFENRLISQKKIYLLQSLGTDLGYSYNWYVRGPYSPTLTNYIYNNLDVLASEDFSTNKLSKSAQKNIDIVNALAQEKIFELNIASWYELLASLLFINNNRKSWNIDDKKQSLYNELLKYKPQYNDEQCEAAYDVLEKKGFVKAGA